MGHDYRTFASKFLPPTLTLAALGALVTMSSLNAQPTASPSPKESKLELATFAGGCFWCTEAVFLELRGVVSVLPGYTGGETKDPTYKEVCSGTTGHAEGIQIEYDPLQVSFADLLEVHWKTHDPTTLNRQGADVGTQYRSAIFYHSEEQRQIALELKAKLDASGAFGKPIVTEIAPFDHFYVAEDYHQNYFADNGRNPYCQAVIRPKLDKFRKVFAEKLKSAPPKAASQPAPGEQSSTGDELQDATDWSKVDWKSRLTPEQYRVTRTAGTERPFDNAFWNLNEDGKYRCVCCGQLLFESDSKFDSGCGWPSFDSPADNKAIDEHVDRTHGMERTEIRCSRCSAHLGHVFDDGPTETGLRYCLNSAAMKFEGEKAKAAE